MLITIKIDSILNIKIKGRTNTIGSKIDIEKLFVCIDSIYLLNKK